MNKRLMIKRSENVRHSMVKLMFVFFSFIFIFISLTGKVHADTHKDGDYEFEINSAGEAIITKYNKDEAGTLEIPDTLKDKEGNEYNVTEIAGSLGTNTGVFAGKEIETITFPKKLKRIGDFAFNTNKLSTDQFNDLPESVIYIGTSAFLGNEMKGHIKIKNGVTHIGNNAFAGNDGITKVTIPETVEKIGFNLVSTALEEVEVIGNNKHYKDINNEGLYTADGKKLLIGTTSGEIAEGTEFISFSAFNYRELKKVRIPDSVTEIEERSFRHNMLNSIELPNSVKKIGERVFDGNSIEEAIIYNREIELGTEIFKGNSEDLNLISYIGSTTENYASDNGHGFSALPIIPTNWEHGLPILGLNDIKLEDEEYHTIGNLTIKVSGNILSATTLRTKDVDSAPEGHYAVGPVLDFIFEEGNNRVDVEGEFKLSLKIDEENDDISIWHKDSKGNWEDVGGDIDNGFITTTVTNFSTYGVFAQKPETIDITVKKEWIGDAEDSVTINLLRNGNFQDYIDLDEQNGWTHTFKDLPLYDLNGDLIEYTVEEEEISGYVAEITGSMEDGFIVTNTEIPEPIYTEITVEKVWIGEAQDSVTVHLLANGVITDSIELSESNEWQHTFLEYPLEDANGIIVYTVEEEAVEGYKTSITGSVEDGFIITNTEIVEDPEVDPCESQDPLASGCPEDEIEDPEKDETLKPTPTPKDDTPKPEKDGKTLPKTATNIFNFVMIGVALLLVGGASLFYYNRRKNMMSKE